MLADVRHEDTPQTTGAIPLPRTAARHFRAPLLICCTNEPDPSAGRQCRIECCQPSSACRSPEPLRRRQPAPPGRALRNCSPTTRQPNRRSRARSASLSRHGFRRRLARRRGLFGSPGNHRQHVRQPFGRRIQSHFRDTKHPPPRACSVPGTPVLANSVPCSLNVLVQNIMLQACAPRRHSGRRQQRSSSPGGCRLHAGNDIRTYVSHGWRRHGRLSIGRLTTSCAAKPLCKSCRQSCRQQ